MKQFVRSVLATAAVVGLVAGAAPAMAASDARPSVTAVGAPTPVRAGADLSALAAADGADGYLYAYDLPNFQGDWCRWDGDDEWWGNDCGNFNDRATSVWNNGFPGLFSEVALRRDVNPSTNQSSFCIEAGNYYADLSLGYERFLDGGWADNAISGHRWFTDYEDYAHDPHYAC
ncbi:peptidase inhibitor family I36 protein [Streptomyces sp. NBC_01451]|uniref:peptidase inhibitor family I36 protein n=1 Tax=Streptomyces sp. NBC_01451 TaxID=2903872 RepID=UPI002E34CD8C|nr:peptidase inhibitor family I36 protein [Streptomyces sp. NBC_01451]